MSNIKWLYMKCFDQLTTKKYATVQLIILKPVNANRPKTRFSTGWVDQMKLLIRIGFHDFIEIS